MSKIFDVNNKFFGLMEKIFDLLVLNLIWVILCIPMVTAVPATIALYYSIVKSIRHERGYAVKEFFRSFKLNFKQGALASIIFFVLFYCLYVDLNWALGITNGNEALWATLISSDNPLEVLTEMDLIALREGINYTMLGVFIVIAFVVFSLHLFLAPVLSRFQMKLVNAYKFSLIISVKHFWVSILCLLLWIAVIVLSVMTNGAVALFAFSGGMLVESFMMEKVLRKYTDQFMEEHPEAPVEGASEEEDSPFNDAKDAKPWYLE